MSPPIGRRRAASVHRVSLSVPGISSPALKLILLGLVLWFVCFSGLGGRMLDTGDWVTPRVGHDLLLIKPPMLYWCQAVFIRLLGPTPLAARLPSAIAAVLTAVVLYYWAKKKGLYRVGWLAAMLYMLTPLVAAGLARLAMMDSLLTLWLSLAIIGWIEGYGGNRKGYWLMAAAMGLATLTKGVIGFLLPALAFSVWVVIRRDWAELRRVSWAPISGIFLLLVLPWHLAAWRANGNMFFTEYIAHNHFQRFLGKDFGHNRSFWYFLPVMILLMIPWTIFLPSAWWSGLRGWRSEKRSLESIMSIWAVWAVVILLFFSAGISKLPEYVLPAMPGLVLLIAWRLDSGWRARRGLAVSEVIALGASGLLAGVCLVVIGLSAMQWRIQPSPVPALARFMGRLAHWDESYGIDALWQKLSIVTSVAPYGIALGVVLLMISAALLLYRRDAPATVVLAMAMSLALIFVGAHIGLPRWVAYNAPLKDLGRRALPALERGEPLILYGLHTNRDSLRYLFGHDEQIYQTASADELKSLLENAGEGYVIEEKDAALPPFPGTAQPEEADGAWALWHARYERYTVEDLRAMLAEDSRMRLLPENVRRVIDALVQHDNSWGDAAQALNVDQYEIQERVHQAALEYDRRKGDRNYQPERILRRQSRKS